MREIEQIEPVTNFNPNSLLHLILLIKEALDGGPRSPLECVGMCDDGMGYTVMYFDWGNLAVKIRSNKYGNLAFYAECNKCNTYSSYKRRREQLHEFLDHIDCTKDID